MYARLAAASANPDLRQQAISEAVSAGDMPLALSLVKQMPAGELSVDSKLLLVADALKRGDHATALRVLSRTKGDADLSFWSPLVQAWSAADRRDLNGAIAALAAVPPKSALSPFVDEETALILLKLGRTAEADPYARRAIASAGARQFRLRLALAAGFANAGDRARALHVVDRIKGDTSALRQAIESRRLKTLAVDTGAKAFSEQLIALAIEMNSSNAGSPAAPINIMQVARYAAPDNSSAAILLGKLFADSDRVDDAVAAFRAVGDADPLESQALDAEARALTQVKRYDQALALANRAATRAGATSDDYARLGDVYSAMDRYNEAAAAYGQAVARTDQSQIDELWPLLLLKASALESAHRWPEAKAALGAAIGMAPNQPLILNFLGYAKLEHGEDLDTAEAMIRKASELAPDDASITDSLGWALYKRGRIEEAIDVLQRAALGDPAQADIQEHLGDALYTAGRRFEARFAWQAALATAEDNDTARLKAKIQSGLTQATAAR